MYKEKELPISTNSQKEEKLNFRELANSKDPFAVNRLTLTNFRNYQRLRLKLSERTVILIGPNGAGKTNVLEALSFLVPGRGLRHVKLSNILNNTQTGGWAVSADVVTPHGKFSIGTGYSLPEIRGARERRVVKIDGVLKTGQNVLAEYVSIIWLTPQMDRLFNDPPSARRGFFDRLVASWDSLHLGRINTYKNKMKERLILLGSGTNIDEHWVSVLENMMVEKGVAIAAARVEFLSRLAPIASRGMDLFPGADISLVGDLENGLQDKPALQVEDWYREALKTTRAKDFSSGKTTFGPHVTDMVVSHKEKRVTANLCSTGEQKTLLISIILAYAKSRSILSGAIPILLLDEIAAHLDEEKREALFSHLTGLQAHAWFTGTDKNLFNAFTENAQILNVKNGSITYS